MRKFTNFIVLVLFIALLIYGTVTLIKISMFNEIKDKILALENVTNYYQEENTNVSIVNDNDKFSYRRFGDTIILENLDSKIVTFEGKTYTFNKKFKCYMEEKSGYIIEHNLVVNDFPIDLINTSARGLVRNVKIQTINLNNEECFALTYKQNGNIYDIYLRKEDAVCMGVRQEIDGEIVYNYYTTRINSQKEEDFTYEAIFGGYDKVIITSFERPYVVRKDGTKEYVIFE